MRLTEPFLEVSGEGQLIPQSFSSTHLIITPHHTSLSPAPHTTARTSTACFNPPLLCEMDRFPPRVQRITDHALKTRIDILAGSFWSLLRKQGVETAGLMQPNCAVQCSALHCSCGPAHGNRLLLWRARLLFCAASTHGGIVVASSLIVFWGMPSTRRHVDFKFGDLLSKAPSKGSKGRTG
jgi:hypothetical protein